MSLETKMAASMKCSFSAFLQSGNDCGISAMYPKELQVVKLSECTRDISKHIQDLRLSSGCQTIKSTVSIVWRVSRQNEFLITDLSF